MPGVKVHEADSVDALYALVDAHPDADLLLMDLNMPGAQGFNALVHLRALHPQLPVVVVSAREEPTVMRRALDHGALSDRFGGRRIILLALALFAVASAGCAFATRIEQLWFWRAMQGLSLIHI